MQFSSQVSLQFCLLTKIWRLHFCGTTSIFRTFFRTYWSAADEETNNITLTRQIQIYGSVYNTGTEMYRWWNVQRVTYLYISVTLCKVNRQSISASENGENFLDQLKEKYRTLCSNRHEHRKSALPFVTSKRIKAPQLSAPLCLTLFSGVIVTVVKNLVRSHGVGLWCK